MDPGVAGGRRVKLSVRNASKTYGPVTALAGTSLEMAEGEFLTLLGPSGSGKTTLLMLIAGLVQPSGGEIWIDGKLATYAEPEKRDIGVVFQNYALFPHLSIAENIAFPLRMRRMPGERIKQEVARVLDIVQLPHVAERLPRELSGGQQQRIALARCIVYGPSIILMDEPLGALDRKLRDRMQLEIKALHRRLGITILYVTHDQDEAMAMSDRICLMNQGRIEQLGTPDDLYFRPATRFAAEFLGDSNIIPSLSGPTGTVMVRPENLRLLGAGEGADNVLEGTMRDFVFVGGVSRCFVDLQDGTELVVAQLTDRGWPRPAPGAPVRVGWDAAQTIMLPA